MVSTPLINNNTPVIYTTGVNQNENLFPAIILRFSTGFNNTITRNAKLIKRLLKFDKPYLFYLQTSFCAAKSYDIIICII